jgi:hypothetical protein
VTPHAFHPGGFAEAHHAAMDAKKLLLLWSLGALGGEIYG